MKKHSMRILGLMLFICVAFVQDSFSQDFKSTADAETAVQLEIDAINNNASQVVKLDGSVANAVDRNSLRYYTAYLTKLNGSSDVEGSFTSVNNEWQSLNYAANWDLVMSEMSDLLLALISEN